MYAAGTAHSAYVFISAWGEESPWERSLGRSGASGSGPSAKSKIIIFILLWILLTGGAVLYFFLSRSVAGPAVDLTFTASNQVRGGQPFTLTVTAANISEEQIKDVRVSMFLPDGVYFMDQPSDQRFVDVLVGDIGPGSVHRNTFQLLAVGTDASVKHFEGKLGYTSAKNEKFQFEKKSTADVPVAASIAALTLTAPQSVLSGKSFELALKYRNNGAQPLTHVTLKVDYPETFQPAAASVKPDKDNGNVWTLNDIAPEQEGSIVISGTLEGPERSFFSVRADLSANFNGQAYILSTQTASLSIYPSPLGLNIQANNSSANYVARIGDSLRYVIAYKNNSDLTLKNVTITARPEGELFDLKNVSTNAAFDSTQNIFTWTVANTPSLAVVAPGQDGSVDIVIPLLRKFPIRTTTDKNYTLRLRARIESPTVPFGTATDVTFSTAGIETKVAGLLAVNARALWRDAPSGILNSGPYPPVVNQPTRYTIHWLISTTAVDMRNIHLSAFLQSGAKWTGKVKSNVDTQPVYETTSGQVIWDIRSLPANKGIIGQPAEAIFQVEVMPAINQIGQDVALMSETRAQGQDIFVNLTLSASDRALTTALPDDVTLSDVRDRRVRE